MFGKVAISCATGCRIERTDRQTIMIEVLLLKLAVLSFVLAVSAAPADRTNTWDLLWAKKDPAAGDASTCYSLHPPRVAHASYCDGVRPKQPPEVRRALRREARLALAAPPSGNASAAASSPPTAFCGTRLPGFANPCFGGIGDGQTTRCLPRFLIIGFTKCGTTALFDYLARHPNVHGPRDKEPGWPVPYVCEHPPLLPCDR